MNELMTEDETAVYLRVQPRTVKNWRYRGTGPRVIKLAGYRVRYRREDVDRWIEEQATEEATA